MKNCNISSCRWLIFCCLFLGNVIFPDDLRAQIADHLYKTDYHIDPSEERQLSVEIDNISFFKDNEYASPLTKGYSLPGLWIQPKAVYNPLEMIRLEAGIHMLIYHGANKYPSMAYKDIADWKGDQYQVGVHILPFFRAQMALSKSLTVVLGNIYGGSNHNLIEPIYNPELNLTSDPEAGLQLLFESRVLDLDAWVNWESFIFRQDLHKEAFTVGLSTRVKFNDPASRFHFYAPVQGLAQHRGGEIDTIYTNSVQTLMNGAAGIGVVWNVNHRAIKNVNFELDATGYYQQAGEIWPFDSGYGLYARASADILDFRVKASYWACHDFISMFGSPFFGAASMKDEGGTFENPRMAYVGVEYSRRFGKGFSLGVDVDVFYHLSGKMTDSKGFVSTVGNSTSFTAGVYLRVNPSFLIKQF